MNLQERSHVFMSKAKKIHGDKYNYTNVRYVNSSTKVTIGCNRCGKLFDQSPMSHISASHPCGCPHCRYQRCHKPKPHTTLDTEKFITKAINVHGTKYTYELVNYINSRTKVIITCPIHGKFNQIPNNHLSSKQGCPECELANKRSRNKQKSKTVEEFVIEATIRYGTRYDYTNILYTSLTEPVTITCPIHGRFTIAIADKHIRGQECPTCCKTNGSSFELRIATILSSHNITYEREKTFDGCRAPISNRKLKYDFYLPYYNMLIEFDGIQHSTPVPFFNNKYSFEKTQIHDLVKTNYAKFAEITLVRITSSTFDEIEALVNRLLS